jgi:hypothetical protein
VAFKPNKNGTADSKPCPCLLNKQCQGRRCICVRKPLPTPQHSSALQARPSVVDGLRFTRTTTILRQAETGLAVCKQGLSRPLRAALLESTPSEESSATSGQEMQGYGHKQPDVGLMDCARVYATANRHSAAGHTSQQHHTPSTPQSTLHLAQNAGQSLQTFQTVQESQEQLQAHSNKHGASPCTAIVLADQPHTHNRNAHACQQYVTWVFAACQAKNRSKEQNVGRLWAKEPHKCY